MFKLGIDPGHGGSDPGALYEGVKEKDINLIIATNIYHLINHFRLKITPYLTRSKSETLTLGDRGERINHLNLDLVLSLHCNAADHALAKSARAFIYPNNEDSFLIGKELLRNSPSSVKPKQISPIHAVKKGWTKRAHNVVAAFKASAVLYEMGFLSNNEDRQFLTSERGRFLTCCSILKVVTEYAHGRRQEE